MKNLIRTLAIALMMAMSCATFAQTTDNNTTKRQRPTMQQRMSREQLAEAQARRIAQSLAFGDAVTERFVKTYCDSQKEVWALRPNVDKRDKQKALTEKENEERIKQRFEMSERLLDIRKKYYKEYSKFLTQAQIEQVYKQEKAMRKHMMQRAQKQRGGKQPAKGGAFRQGKARNGAAQY